MDTTERLSFSLSKGNNINELIYKAETNLENELMVTKGEEIDRECAIDMYTLLYLKQIINKGLLYSTGNCAHCYVTLHVRGVWRRKDTFKRWLSCSETITALLISPNQLSVQFSSVAHSCMTLCDPMNRSTSGLPVH